MKKGVGIGNGRFKDIEDYEVIDVVDMDNSILSRWLGLQESIDIIYNASIRKGKDFKTVKLPSPHIQKYVNAKCDYIHNILDSIDSSND